MAMNPEWEIHWTLTGQTHLYGWVDIDGLRCRVTMARREARRARRGRLGHGPAPRHLHRRAGVYAATGGTGPVPWRPYGGQGCHH